MKIQIQEKTDPKDIIFPSWDISLLSTPLDYRGNLSTSFVKGCCKEIITLKYIPHEFKIEVNGSKINSEDEKFLSDVGSKSIVLDATTLGFAELLLSIKRLKILGIDKIDVIYLEPGGYNNPRSTSLLSKRDFELSGEMFGYMAIPGTTLMLSDRSKQRGVFILGYEGSRFDRALEEFEIDTSNVVTIFGIPAFKTGWEIPSISNNVRVIKDKNVRSELQYCSASNPDSSLRYLEEVYESLQPEERMFIVPLGSTPMGIGVILFLLNHSDVGVLYDHPERSPGRSNSVSKWHLYEIEF